jgi:hypothetical protein
MLKGSFDYTNDPSVSNVRTQPPKWFVLFPRGRSFKFAKILFRGVDWFVPGISEESQLCGRILVVSALAFITMQLTFLLFAAVPFTLILALLRLGKFGEDGLQKIFFASCILGIIVLHLKYISSQPQYNLYESFNSARTSKSRSLSLCSHYSVATITWTAAFVLRFRYGALLNVVSLAYGCYLYENYASRSSCKQSLFVSACAYFAVEYDSLKSRFADALFSLLCAYLLQANNEFKLKRMRKLHAQAVEAAQHKLTFIAKMRRFAFVRVCADSNSATIFVRRLSVCSDSATCSLNRRSRLRNRST